MRILQFTICFLALITSFMSLAQPKIDRSKELQMGDTFKSSQVVEILNDKVSQFDFSAYKEELLVLDFFDTFCTACIANMPKVVTLQKEFEGKVKFLQVTWQDKKTIQDLFRTNKFLKENQAYPPVIFSDTVLRNLFPHQSAPHVVWIYKGKLIAITAVDVLNSNNINELLSNGKISLPAKNDYLPLSIKEDRITDGIAFSKVSAFNPGLKKSGYTFQMDSVGKKYLTSFNNMPLLNIYLSLLNKMEQKDFLVTKHRIDWRVKDKNIYTYDDDEKEATRWMEKYAVCYERVDKMFRNERDHAKVVYTDINNFFGLNVYYGKAKRKCLVLSKTAVNKSTQIKEANLQSLEGTSVLAFVVDYSKQYMPVIDEVKSMDNITLGDYNNLEELNRQLSAYGLVLTPDEREIDVVIFKEI